jgi:hypothetical protein
MDAVFVEKVLRVQPNVKKLYLLLRAPDAKSATQRFHNEVYFYSSTHQKKKKERKSYTHIYIYIYIILTRREIKIRRFRYVNVA